MYTWYYANGRKWIGTKEPLNEGERGEWKNWLKTQHSKHEDLGIQAHHFMANRGGNNGNSGKLYFPGLQNCCRQWLQAWNQKCLLLERKAITNLDNILKSREITLPTKVHIVKAMVFPVVMYGCESWTIKKAECRRIDAFELWCWRRLDSPLDSKEIQLVHPKGNQSWIFIGRTDAEATQIHLPPNMKNRLPGKDPGAGKAWGQEGKQQQRMRRLDDVTDSMDVSLSKLWVMVKDRKPDVLPPMGSQSQTWFSDGRTTV